MSRQYVHSRGFTLVEFMVAIALGLFVTTVVLKGFAATSAVSSTNSAVAESNTNARQALEELKREVRHAVLQRMVWDPSQVVDDAGALAAMDFGCETGFVKAVGGVHGYNDHNPFPGSCLATAGGREYARGDVLVLRRTSRVPATTFDIGAPYVRTAYGAASAFIGNTPTTAPMLAEPNLDYRMVNDVYFVNAFTNDPNETPRVPALYRLTLPPGENPRLTPELVASNVEHFQVQYAVADAGGAIRYFNAHEVPNWAAVKMVRIWLLMRESTPEAGFASDTYGLGDVTAYTPGDNFRRTVYSSVIAIRNP